MIAVNTTKLVAELRLTSNDTDKDGDLIVPTGGRYHLHRKRPAVNLHHLRRVDGGWQHGSNLNGEQAVVGWCRETLSRPGGEYTIGLREFPGWHNWSPVATVHFDPHCRLAMETFKAIERKDLTGVSVEIIPREWTPSGRGRRIAVWDLFGIALTRNPINPVARVLKCQRLTPEEC